MNIIISNYFCDDITNIIIDLLPYNNRYYLERKWDQIIKLVPYAAKNGYLDLLKWYKKNGNDPFDSFICSIAAVNGHLHILKWARENNCHCQYENIAGGAAYGGHLEILKWALENKCFIYSKCSVYQDALEGKHPHMIKWLKENDFDVDFDVPDS